MKNRFVLGLCVLLVAFSLLLGGCSDSASEAPKKAVAPKQVKEQAAAPSGPQGSCEEFEECPSGTATCIFGRCWTEEGLWASFSECDYKTGSAQECEAKDCAGCKSGKFSCFTTGSTAKTYDICAECATDFHCQDGRSCDMGSCAGGSAPVPAPSAPAAVDTEVGSGDPILGKWKYQGYPYFFKENGDVMLETSGTVNGLWENVGGREYTVTWPSYGNVEEVTLSEDGSLLTGVRRGSTREVEMKRLE
ncbi:MAG: hypothetical protein KKD17_05625 [Nanoarchaeota archaeon]|nr:hypothetical protein [Nanoarchaeota archaeon]